MSQLTLERLHFLHWKLLATILELENFQQPEAWVLECLDNWCTLDTYLSSGVSDWWLILVCIDIFQCDSKADLKYNEYIEKLTWNVFIYLKFNARIISSSVFPSYCTFHQQVCLRHFTLNSSFSSFISNSKLPKADYVLNQVLRFSKDTHSAALNFIPTVR